MLKKLSRSLGDGNFWHFQFLPGLGLREAGLLIPLCYVSSFTVIAEYSLNCPFETQYHACANTTQQGVLNRGRIYTSGYFTSEEKKPRYSQVWYLCFQERNDSEGEMKVKSLEFYF